MKIKNTLGMETQAVITHLVVRVLCLIIVEYECLMRILEATGKNYQTGNWILASAFTTAAVLCFFFPKKIWGYAIGIGFALFNIGVKLYFVITGHEHYTYWPIVWISQCLIIIYFCIKGIRSSRKNLRQAKDL